MPPAPANVLTKAPVLKRFVEATYPPSAESLQLAGTVVLEIDIGANGLVSAARVVQPAGHGFDEAAALAVRQFVFEPAEIDHRPAPVRVTYRYEFVWKEPALEVKPSAPGPVTLEGVALERGTRQPIAEGLVVAEREGTRVEAPLGEGGRFAFRALAPGLWAVTVFVAGFDRFTTNEEIRAGEVTVATYRLRRRAGEFETTIRGKREAKEVARRTITLEEIRKIPGTQGDAIRVVQNLPGVARTPLGLGPLIVRGGRPGDTRTYIDGQVVPLLFHFGGLTSVINSEFLDTLDFYPGNFPVRYGRSIAGAVDVNTRAGRRDRVRGYANVSLTESTLFLEGPIPGVPAGAFMASVRRSYIDVVLPVVFLFTDFGRNVDFQIAPRYWDYQLKADFDLGRDKLSLFLFGSDDRLAFALPSASSVAGEGRNDLTSRIGFHRLTASWRRRLGAGWENRLVVTLGTDVTSNEIGADLKLQLDLNSLAVRDEVTWKPSDALQLTFGADVLVGDFAYTVQAPKPPPPGEFFNPLLNDQLIRATDSGLATQPAFFADAVWRPIPALKLVPGVRVDFDDYINRAWFDPRVTVFFEAPAAFVLKGGVGRYHQPPTPDKLTKRFGNPALREEGTTQYALGFERRFLDAFDVDVQVYFREIFDEAVRTQQLSTTAAQLAAGGMPLLNAGIGEAYGVELLVRKPPGGRFFGWIALSLGQATRRAAPGEPWVQSAANQRYNLVGVGTWKLPWWALEAGTRVRLTDGNPANGYLGAVLDSDSDLYLPIQSPNRRSERLPSFFQIDVRVDRRFAFDEWVLEAFLEVQNVLNYPNVEANNWNYDFTRSAPTTGLPVFPFFGVKAEY